MRSSTSVACFKLWLVTPLLLLLAKTDVRRILAGARRLGAVVVDAADMGARPDELRLLDEGLIAEQPFLTTHKLPLIFLLKLLREFVPIVQLLSIQPAVGGVSPTLCHQRSSERWNSFTRT